MIGASAAGVSAAMASRQAGFTGEIVVVGAEPHPPYERPPLSKRLVDVDDVESALSPIIPADQLRSNQVVLRLGLRVRAIDPSAAGVLLGDGEILPADSVLLATGARPRRLNVSGRYLEGICYLRTADDALRLGRRLRWQAPVVVVGAGFVGLEVAAVARDLGRQVIVVEALRQPLLGTVGPLLGSVFAAVHREQGVHLSLAIPPPGCASSKRNNALYQGAAVGRTIAARPSTDDSVPYFWSDQYDVKLQIFGRPVVDQP